MAEGAVVEVDRPVVGGNPFDDKTTIKVMLAEPSSGYVDAFVHDNRLDFYMELARLEARSKFKFFTGNVHRLHVSYAREVICSEALKLGMDYLLMVDDDMLIPKTTFERLFKTMQREKAHIAAPLCTQRIPPFNPVMYRLVTEDMEENGVKGKRFKNTTVTDYEINSIQELDAVGFGVVLIDLRVIAKMKEPRFFSNTNVGEDIYFCWKAKKDANAKVICDTSIKIGHLKVPEMATEYDFMRANKLEAKFKGIYDHINDARSIEAVDAK